MGDRLRSAWPNPVARRRDSKAHAGTGGLEFSLGHRLSAAAMERGREQMERGASSIYAAESGGHATTGGEEVWRDSGQSLRRRSKRSRDRRREHANSRAGFAGKDVRSAWGQRARSTID